jgi:hypothetical protein
MHPDRSGPPVLRVCCLKEAPTRPHAACTDVAAPVVGLGAPVSVRIRLTPGEIPLLRGEILKRLHARTRPTSARREHQHDGFADNELAWCEMLAQLDGGEAAEEIYVLWPTAYADLALRDALTQALIGVLRAPDGGLPQLGEALATAQALLATLTAFHDIDRGGLQDVDL